MSQEDRELKRGDPAGSAGNLTPVGPGTAETGQGSGPAAQQGYAKGRPLEFDHQSAGPGSTSGHAPATNEKGAERTPVDDSIPASVKPALKGSWTAITIVCALMLTVLLIAGIILVTRPRATIDQLLILTVPSGADVSFDGKALGPSPVKLEGVKMGMHKVLVTKDGYQEVQRDETITDSRTLDYKLKLLPPPGAEDLPEDEAIRQYKQNMEDAFARGDYAIPYYGKSALYFAQLILDHDSSNSSALEMKDRVLKALVQSTQAAMSRMDLAQAQEIVSVLLQYFPTDSEARAAAGKLEAQIAVHRSDVRELVRKAEEALQGGNLIDPPRSSAFYYAKQALTLDHQNQRAKSIRTEVHDRVLQSIAQTMTTGTLIQATKELDQALRFFPEDTQLKAKQKELEQQQAAEAKASDPKERRLRGLQNTRNGNFAEAIPDLEFALQFDRGGPEVLFALGWCHKKLREFDRALEYLSRVRQSSDDSYRSALAAQGEIEAERGNLAAAAEHYKKARDLGGSTLYSTADLQDRIDSLEKKQVGKTVVEPTPLTIHVKHIHGGILHGSCSGTLTVNESGVRYDGSDHTFSANLVHAGVRVSKEEMAVQFQDKSEKFKPDRPGDAERFREAVSRYHSAESAAK
jgi:tetratricopeptide (TPR) repeat protein